MAPTMSCLVAFVQGDPKFVTPGYPLENFGAHFPGIMKDESFLTEIGQPI